MTTAAAAPKAPGRWALAGALLGLLAALVVHAPAAWLGTAVAAASAQNLGLADARGSLWRGDARLVVAPGSASATALPGRLAWSFYWQDGGAGMQWRADCCTDGWQDLRLQLQPGAAGLVVQLADGVSRWPAGLLAAWGAPWNTVRPQGTLQLATRTAQLRWSGADWQLQGSLSLEALAMASRLSPVRPLGSYRATLEGAGAAPARLRLDTLEGPLRLSGNGSLAQGRLRFDGEASAGAQDLPALENLLNMLGRREGARALLVL